MSERDTLSGNVSSNASVAAQLRECQSKLAAARNREARYEDALTEILAVRLDESGSESQAYTFDEARRKMRAIAEEALRDTD